MKRKTGRLGISLKLNNNRTVLCTRFSFAFVIDVINVKKIIINVNKRVY